MIITERLNWGRVYWIRGIQPKNMWPKNGIKDPPCSGWQHTFIIPKAKTSILFCPYSFFSYRVKNDCGELIGMKEPENNPIEWAKKHLKQTWHQFQKYGWQRDYTIAAYILKELNTSVPTTELTTIDNKRGGKPVNFRLIKSVKTNSKRGRFLKWFIAGDFIKSMREVMVEFDMSRSNAASYLFMLEKDHGIGYTIINGVATITLPSSMDIPLFI